MFNLFSDREKERQSFHGNYRGIVEDVEDPMNVGRVKIRVMSVYDDLDTVDMPWAIYADPFMGGSKNKGGFFVPDLGDTVWVFFEQGDHMQPVYFAGAPAQPHLPDETREAPYYKNRMWKTKTGHFLEFNDGEETGQGYIRITHRTGSYIMLDDEGNITIDSVNDLYENVGRNYVLTVQGDSTEDTKGNKEVRANRIDYNRN